MFFYHYCTVRQGTNGAMIYADGVITTTLPLTADDYEDTRRDIAGRIGVEPNCFVLLSLSLLSQSEPK